MEKKVGSKFFSSEYYYGRKKSPHECDKSLEWEKAGFLGWISRVEGENAIDAHSRLLPIFAARITPFSYKWRSKAVLHLEQEPTLLWQREMAFADYALHRVQKPTAPATRAAGNPQKAQRAAW